MADPKKSESQQVIRESKIAGEVLRARIWENYEKAQKDFTERYDRNMEALAQEQTPWVKLTVEQLQGLRRDSEPKVVAEVAERLLENIARLRATVELQERTDDGLSQLEKLYAPIFGAPTEEKLASINKALTIIRERRDLAGMFLENGPDEVDPKDYVKGIGVEYVIRFDQSRRGGPTYWYRENSSAQWREGTEDATMYPSRAAAEEALTRYLRAHNVPEGSNQKLGLDIVGVWEGRLVEADEADVLDPKDYTHRANWDYLVTFTRSSGRVFYFNLDLYDEGRHHNGAASPWVAEMGGGTRFKQEDAQEWVKYWQGVDFEDMAKQYAMMPVMGYPPTVQENEEEFEDVDPDVPVDSKGFLMNLDQRGRERIEELARIKKWPSNGEWYIPYTSSGGYSDFYAEANYKYFKEKYPFLNQQNQQLGFDKDTFPDEYDTFEMFLSQIDQSDWESFIEDVTAAENGLCMDEDDAFQREQAETDRFIKEDFLPDLKRELKEQSRFYNSFYQFLISEITASDVYDLMNSQETYPESQGDGTVYMRAEKFAENVDLEDLQDLFEGKPMQQQWEAKKREFYDLEEGAQFNKFLEEAVAANPEAQHAYSLLTPDDAFLLLKTVVPDSNFASDLPCWDEVEVGRATVDEKAPRRWVVTHAIPHLDTTNYWREYVLRGVQDAAKMAAELLPTWSRPVTDHPELPLGEAVDPDAVDPRDYLNAVAAYWGIGHQNKARTIWYTGNPWDKWSFEIDDAKRFKSQDEAASFCRNFGPDWHVDIKPIRLPELHQPGVQQEAVDPDSVDPKDYLRSMRKGFVVRTTGQLGRGNYWYKDKKGDGKEWTQDITKARVFETEQDAMRIVSFYHHYFYPLHIEPAPPGFAPEVIESVDPDAVDPKKYLGQLKRKYVARIDDKRIIRAPDGSHTGQEVVPLWFSKNPFGWWPDRSKATVYDSPRQMYEVYLGLPDNRRKLVVIEPADIVGEGAGPDNVDPKGYLSDLQRGWLLKHRAADGSIYFFIEEGPVRAPGQYGCWTHEEKESYLFARYEDAVQWKEHFEKKFEGEPDTFWVEPKIDQKSVTEARQRDSELPPDEDIDYKSWVTHGGYDSGRELYSDSEVRIFLPSTIHTLEKYGIPLRNASNEEWDRIVEPGPIFLIIPSQGTPWAIREWYDEIRELSKDGRQWTVYPDEIIKTHPAGQKVGAVLAKYFKKKIKVDFDKYFKLAFQFGGLTAVRGYLKNLKVGANDQLDNAIGIEAALEGKLDLASKFWQYPRELLTKNGAWIYYDDYNDLARLFKDDNRSSHRSAAEKVFSNETYDWFDFLWGQHYPPKDITGYLTPEHYAELRRVLVGRSILIDDEPLLLTSESLKHFSDRDIEEWLDNYEDYQDGGDLEDIAEALGRATGRALETIYADAYFKGYLDVVKDALSSEYKWVKVGDKDKLAFFVPWKAIREMLAKFVEDNNEPYQGPLNELPESALKLEAHEEYHGSLDDDKSVVVDSLSNELSELEPKRAPRNPAQPELFDAPPANEPPPLGEALDPDVIDYRKYLRNFKHEYVIRIHRELDGHVMWVQPSGGWRDDIMTAHRFTKSGAAEFIKTLYTILQVNGATATAELAPVTEALNESLLMEGYKFAVTLIPLPREIAGFVTTWGEANIPDEWLYVGDDGDKGREKEPHVTVLYGITTNDVPDELRQICATTRPFPIFFEKVTVFNTNPDYDVLKIDIESPWLHELHKRIKASVPNESKFPDYHPHCTLAYVKKGVADKLVGTDMFAGGVEKPQFTAMGMMFKGAAEDSDDPNRTKESLLFSTVKKPKTESVDPDAISAKDYLNALRRPYGISYVSPNRGHTIYFHGLKNGPSMDYLMNWTANPADAMVFKTPEEAQQMIDKQYALRRQAKSREGFSDTQYNVLPLPLVQQEAGPDDVDPKHYLNQVPIDSCNYCGQDLGQRESIRRDYLGSMGEVTSCMGHLDKSGYFEPDEFIRLDGNFNLLEDSDFCGNCGRSLLTGKLAESGPDDIDARDYVKQMPLYYIVKGKMKPEFIGKFDPDARALTQEIFYFDTAGGSRSEPHRMTYSRALKVVGFVKQDYPWFDVEALPADDQSQMYWQGRRTPQEIGEGEDPDAIEPKEYMQDVPVKYVIRKINNRRDPNEQRLLGWLWNNQWGWRTSSQSATRFNSREEADDVIRAQGLQGYARVEPFILESAPAPFERAPFPVDSSQLIRFLRSKRPAPQLL